MIRVVPTGDLGLDVLLGGGWRLIKRFEDKESATVIVRGGSGAGKTLLGIQAAIELARALGGDVAVGCVEILPTEYVAQLQSARPALAADRVARLPARAVSDDGPRVYVGLLQLEGDEPDLVTALENLDASVREAGGNPTAFIVDSLIEGYGLGASRARIDVDDILKFAVRYGRGLVLCEETPTEAPSPWVFAADTVLHVGVESRERGRWIEVKKHRFGPAAPGRHELDLVASGQQPAIYPEAHAWRALAQWALGFAPQTPRIASPIVSCSDSTLPNQGRLEFRGRTVVVAAPRESTARFVAMSLAPHGSAWATRRFIEIDPTARTRDGGFAGGEGPPLLVDFFPTSESPARFLSHALYELRLMPSDHRTSMVIGDLRHVLMSQTAEAWLDAIESLCVIAIEARPLATVIVYSGEIRGGHATSERLHRNAEVFISANASANEISASGLAREDNALFSAHWPPNAEAITEGEYLRARSGRRLRS